jgi:hypothetical protein
MNPRKINLSTDYAHFMPMCDASDFLPGQSFFDYVLFGRRAYGVPFRLLRAGLLPAKGAAAWALLDSTPSFKEPPDTFKILWSRRRCLVQIA